MDAKQEKRLSLEHVITNGPRRFGGHSSMVDSATAFLHSDMRRAYETGLQSFLSEIGGRTRDVGAVQQFVVDLQLRA